MYSETAGTDEGTALLTLTRFVLLLLLLLLYKRTHVGTADLEVPPPDKRVALVEQMHHHTGHFGSARTYSMLRNHFWWHSKKTDCEKVVAGCKVCDRVNNTRYLGNQPQELHSLPISGLFYRWSFDLAGPFQKSSRGNTYALIAVEHFSKWVELEPIPTKESAHTARILDQILHRFGACGEILTDQG